MKTHEELIAKMLADPAVKAEYDRLNASEEFMLLDLVLAARQSATAFELLTALPDDFMQDGRADSPAQVREGL